MFPALLRRFRRRATKRLTGVALVGLVALSTLSIHAFHLFIADENLLGLLFGAVFPTLFSLLLLGSCHFLYRSSFGDRTLRIALWTLGGITILVTIAAFSVVHQQMLGTEVRELPFTLNNYATGGAVLGLLVGVHDAQWKMTEEQLQCERATAEVLSHRLSVLNRVLRHDIRTNVNIIHGYAEAIFDDSKPVYVAGRIIRKKAVELHRLSENARLIERTLGDDGIETRSVDLAPIVAAEVRSVAEKYPQARLDLSLPDSARVEANELVETALANVLENAVEHNDGDAPTISIRIADAVATPDEFVEVRVADDGPGIPEAQKEVLHRGHETDLEHSDGLGLWLANWIVYESGGEIRFEENDPEGTVVIVGFRPAERSDRA